MAFLEKQEDRTPVSGRAGCTDGRKKDGADRAGECDGKRMHGRAIPVSTPYRLTASVADILYRMREAGMETASMLWSRG